jgi:hypothetical protein
MTLDEEQRRRMNDRAGECMKLMTDINEHIIDVAVQTQRMKKTLDEKAGSILIRAESMLEELREEWEKLDTKLNHKNIEGELQ